MRTERLRLALDAADAVVIGAGAGLSTAAGLAYGGERFRRYFADFEALRGFHDMYAGGFFPFPTEEERWAFWSRNIWVNRYQAAPRQTYGSLLGLMRDKDYFVITTNVDHQFQKAGFDKKRLFYTQGDYGLFQCARPCCQTTWDNEQDVRRMVESQGFVIDQDGSLAMPDGVKPKTEVPSNLVPRCKHCGGPAALNLRCDDTFVEDEGWHRAAERYENFLRTRRGQRVLFLELGVGYNTPGIIKYPFWQMTAANPKATYACINQGQATTPREMEHQSLCLDADIDEVVRALASGAA